MYSDKGHRNVKTISEFGKPLTYESSSNMRDRSAVVKAEDFYKVPSTIADHVSTLCREERYDVFDQHRPISEIN